MRISLLHAQGACSSLILYHFDPNMRGDKDSDSDGFNPQVKELLKNFSYYSMSENRDYKTQDFAFMVASTSHRQPVTEECLRKLGFTESERVAKNKNPNHEVKFWVISIPLLFSNLGLES